MDGKNFWIPFVYGGPYSVQNIMDYISWIGLEGTQEYSNQVQNEPTELAKKIYAESAARNHYTHNCN